MYTNRIKKWKKKFSLIIIIIINNLRYECSFYKYIIFLSPLEKTSTTRTTETRRGVARETHERYRTVADRRLWRTDDVTDTNIIRIYDTGRVARVVRPGGYVLAAVPVRERVSSLPPGVGTVRPSPPGTRWHTPPIAR